MGSAASFFSKSSAVGCTATTVAEDTDIAAFNFAFWRRKNACERDGECVREGVGE